MSYRLEHPQYVDEKLDRLIALLEHVAVEVRRIRQDHAKLAHQPRLAVHDSSDTGPVVLPFPACADEPPSTDPDPAAA